MIVLYLNYWGFYDGLTQATSMPSICYLANQDRVDKLILVSIERNGFIKSSKNILPKNVIHYKWYTFQNPIGKIIDFFILPLFLLGISIFHSIKFTQCRGAITGFYGYVLYKIFKIPFGVESFEPHLDYMIESGVWRPDSISAKFQFWIEKKVKENATLLLTVSENYKNRLLQEKKAFQYIEVQPCPVNFQLFKFQDNLPIINIPEDLTVGIYVGKFGDIYYDLESFEMFKKTYEFFNQKFFLIVLSPDHKEEIIQKLNQFHFPLQNVFIDKVPHHAVPQYLALADFAFSNVKPAPCRKYCCPTKNGEYWAMGLPILTPDDIGDDTDIIRKEQGGVIYDLSDFNQALNTLNENYLKTPKIIRKEKIRKIAEKYRNFENNSNYLDLIVD